MVRKDFIKENNWCKSHSNPDPILILNYIFITKIYLIIVKVEKHVNSNKTLFTCMRNTKTEKQIFREQRKCNISDRNMTTKDFFTLNIGMKMLSRKNSAGSSTSNLKHSVPMQAESWQTIQRAGLIN